MLKSIEENRVLPSQRPFYEFLPQKIKRLYQDTYQNLNEKLRHYATTFLHLIPRSTVKSISNSRVLNWQESLFISNEGKVQWVNQNDFTDM